MTDFSAALAALAPLASGATPKLCGDDYERVRFEWEVSDAVAALVGAPTAVAAGWAVRLRLENQDGETGTLLLESSDRWLVVDGQPTTLLEHLKGPADHYSNAELLAAGAAESFATLTTRRCEVTLRKGPWRDPIVSQTGRGIWIGPNQDGFVAWLNGTSAQQIANQLFDHAGASILLNDWTGPARGSGVLTIGGIDDRPAASDDDAVLVQRLDARGESGQLPEWRLIGVDPTPLPSVVQTSLRRVIGLCAVGLLTSPRDGGQAPSPAHEKRWEVPVLAGMAQGDFVGITALMRWVAADLSEARLEIAREIAATRIDDPALNRADRQVVEAAQFAMLLHVQRDVRESLDRQHQLEVGFRELDEKVAALRDKQADAIDATLTKVAAAAIAITISALTSAKVRNWPATWAALVLAAYLALSIKATWSLRSNALHQLGTARDLAEKRVESLGTELTATIDYWQTDIKRRACFTIAVFATAIVLVLAAGFFQNTKLGGHDHHPNTETTKTNTGAP